MRLKAMAALVGAVAVSIATSSTTRAQVSLAVAACKKVEATAQALVFVEIRYGQCGTRFSSKDPYVALVAHLRSVEDRTRVTVELLDPAGTVVWKIDETYTVPPGSRYPDIWVWGVLPVAADVATLAAQDVAVKDHVILLGQKSATERPGEWTLRAHTTGADVQVVRFTLRREP